MKYYNEVMTPQKHKYQLMNDLAQESQIIMGAEAIKLAEEKMNREIVAMPESALQKDIATVKSDETQTNQNIQQAGFFDFEGFFQAIKNAFFPAGNPSTEIGKKLRENQKKRGMDDLTGKYLVHSIATIGIIAYIFYWAVFKK